MDRRNRLTDNQRPPYSSPNIPPVTPALSPLPPRPFERRHQQNPKSNSLTSRLRRKKIVQVQDEEGVRMQYYGEVTKAKGVKPYIGNKEEEVKGEQSVSTQLSKQEQVEKRVVKFSENVVVEGARGDFTRKKEEGRGRSPSILKNSKNVLNGSMIADRSYSATSRDRPPEEEGASSKAVRQRFKAIIARLEGGQNRGQRFSGLVYQTRGGRSECPKYQDQIFPPVYSSLFAVKRGKNRRGEEIGWVRVGQLFVGRRLVLGRPECGTMLVTRGEQSYASDFLVSAFNCIRNSKKLMERMFQSQGVSNYGAYLVRIFQQNTWKYIIIDDFIPVVRDPKGNLIPAFIKVTSSTDTIDIWPFLLEKAYANFYSSYQSLHLGSFSDFVEELAGAPFLRIPLKPDTQRKQDCDPQMPICLKKFSQELKSQQVVCWVQSDDGKIHYPLQGICQQGATILDCLKGYEKKKMEWHDIEKNYRVISVVRWQKLGQGEMCVLRKGRGQGEIKQEGLIEKQEPSIRIFRTDGGDSCVWVRQRDRRFFPSGQYLWNRVILLQKEGQGHGFRWIDGDYSQNKSVRFFQRLQAGQYWLVLLPQWRTGGPGELGVQIFGGNCLQRRPYQVLDGVLEQGCMDLAQRRGQLNQINKFICSYNYLSEKVGLIIQNIVNERINGEVTVMRSIRGLKCKVQILPLNPQFYEQIGQFLRLKEQIELDIPKGGQYTVVLRLRGGIDRKFFKSFDFGC